MSIGLFHLISIPPLSKTSGILQGTSKVGVEFFRALVKLVWNSSGYGYHCDRILQGTNKVDVEFLRVL